MENTRQQLQDYATEYTIGKYKLVWKGKGWAIMEDMFRFNGEISCFDIEPSPSNRTDKYIKDASFGLLEAKEIIEKLNN